MSIARIAVLLPALLLVGCMANPPAQETPSTESASTAGATSSSGDSDRSFLGSVLLYLPNRVFDVLDIGRARLRAGLGIAGGVRFTKPLTLFAGFYTTIWAGLHGPRGKEGGIPWPIGGESRAGAQASVVDVTAGAPYYGWAEIGFDVQLFIIGAAVGVAPWEVVDFAVGIIGFDPVGDDF